MGSSYCEEKEPCYHGNWLQYHCYRAAQPDNCCQKTHDIIGSISGVSLTCPLLTGNAANPVVPIRRQAAYTASLWRHSVALRARGAVVAVPSSGRFHASDTPAPRASASAAWRHRATAIYGLKGFGFTSNSICNVAVLPSSRGHGLRTRPSTGATGIDYLKLVQGHQCASAVRGRTTSSVARPGIGDGDKVGTSDCSQTTARSDSVFSSQLDL